MTTDDFSFPTITETPLRFIDSPPLWRSRHEETKRGGPEGEEDSFSATKPIKYSQRKSFSSIEGGLKRAIEDEEEKMDMLWEDFNEELSNSCESGPDSGMLPGRVVEFGCVQALKLSKTELSGKRSSVMVFMKLLKKLFLLHNIHRKVKKSAW